MPSRPSHDDSHATAPARLLSPLQLGRRSDLVAVAATPLALPNRVVMAPLTRCRATPGGIPDALNAEYYRQRASAGLIIAEATQITQQGQGYPNTPGIYTPEQIAGWRLVTQAVHDAGGRIVLQLWHVGRISHNAYQPGGAAPVSASDVTQPGTCRLPDGTREPYPAPRPLELAEIPSIIDHYRHAARCARLAGFDGVEVHGANGYLIDQFLRDGTNLRTDRYGGSITNRIRFAVEVTRAVCECWPVGRVGIRLSPNNMGNGRPGGASDSDPLAVYSALVTELSSLPLAYLHIMEAFPEDGVAEPEQIPVRSFRHLTDLPIITNVGFTQSKAEMYLAAGFADAVAFGKLYISNPDLVTRFAHAEAGRPAPLAQWDATTFYPTGPGPRETGYTDYPTLPIA